MTAHSPPANRPSLKAEAIFRPIGNPLPLAFLSLGVGTLTLSAMQLGWVPDSEGRDLAIVLIAFVFPLQLVATIFAFLARDGAAAGGTGMVAGHWLVIGLVTLAAAPGSTSKVLGIFLLGASSLLLVPALTSVSTKSVVAAVIAGAALRFALTGIYELTGTRSWEDAAGLAGLAVFVLAFYAGLALSLADSRHGSGPLPVGRGGGPPLTVDPAEAIEREPGVRPQL